MTAFWLMIAVVTAASLAFVSVMVWLGNRAKEGEARFRSEMALRIAQADDPEPVLAYLREVERNEQADVRLRTRLAGMIICAVGVGLMIFLYVLIADAPVYLVGLIPLLIGAVLLLASEVVMRKDE